MAPHRPSSIKLLLGSTEPHHSSRQGAPILPRVLSCLNSSSQTPTRSIANYDHHLAIRYMCELDVIVLSLFLGGEVLNGDVPLRAFSRLIIRAVHQAALFSSFSNVGPDEGKPRLMRVDRKHLEILAACTAAMNSLKRCATVPVGLPTPHLFKNEHLRYW
jgi:hypothetical protein